MNLRPWQLGSLAAWHARPLAGWMDDHPDMAVHLKSRFCPPCHLNSSLLNAGQSPTPSKVCLSQSSCTAQGHHAARVSLPVLESSCPSLSRPTLSEPVPALLVPHSGMRTYFGQARVTALMRRTIPAPDPDRSIEEFLLRTRH